MQKIRMKKILVIDDNEDILNDVEEILISHNFEVYTHYKASDLQEVTKRNKPDLILLDIRLPGKLGTDVCKELKQLDSKLPIVLFSAHAEKEKTLGSCGANDFLEKPFDIKSLIDTINLHVN